MTRSRIPFSLLSIFFCSLLVMNIGCSKSGVDLSPKNKWDFFWNSFSRAVKDRDRASLRTMMTEDFNYTFGDGQQIPENAFKYWDLTEIQGWDALSQAISNGAIDYVPPSEWGYDGKVKIGPPQASTDGYRQWRAIFVQQKNGEWKWVAFLNGD